MVSVTSTIIPERSSAASVASPAVSPGPAPFAPRRPAPVERRIHQQYGLVHREADDEYDPHRRLPA